VNDMFEIFFSYAHEDEALMNEVRRQLIVYERNGRILKWHDRMIPAGSSWRDQIDDRLQSADIILLFMSPHFIESRYCYEVEGQAALERQNSGKAKVIPIILRPCAWDETPFSELQALPTDAKPISQWADCDEASLITARGIMREVEKASNKRDYTTELEASEPKNKNSGQVAQGSGTKNINSIYCKRCGQPVGNQSTCTGAYTHHEFISGKASQFCSRCGIAPGTKTMCTGAYTHHNFINNDSLSVHCVRCGISIGKQSTCTGAYTHHSFKGL